MKTLICFVSVALACMAMGGPEPSRPAPFVHRPEGMPGTVWQKGTPAGSYTSGPQGGWTYRSDGKVAATYTPSATGGTLWEKGQAVGSYSTQPNGGWTYWEKGKVAATYTPSAGGGGTVWQNGTVAGRYTPSGNGGWTYWEGGRIVATQTPSASARRPEPRKTAASAKPPAKR